MPEYPGCLQLENIPDKRNWKKMLKESVNLFVEKKWKEEIREKRSLKYLNPDSLKVGQTHHVYSTVRPNKEDIKRSELKVKLLLGTYTLPLEGWENLGVKVRMLEHHMKIQLRMRVRMATEKNDYFEEDAMLVLYLGRG